MDLRQLRYFQAVAHTGRISEAARQLGVSQPALSIALAKLEREVGVVLLLRDHRGVQLTTGGRELLGVVTSAIDMLEQGRQRIAGLENEAVGRMVIGCPHALGSYLLPGFVGPFLAAYPRIELSLRNGSSRVIEAAVLRRDVQLGLVTHALSHPDLVLLDLFRDEVALVVAADEAGQGKQPEGGSGASWGAAVSLIRRRALIYVPEVPQALEVMSQLTARGIEPARRIECGDLQLVKELALAGAGVAILPRRVAAHGRAGRLRAVHPRMPSVADTIRLIYRSDMHRSRAALTVKDALVAHGRAIDAEAA